MSQRRLDSLWGAPTAKISDWELKVGDASKITSVKVKAEAQEMAVAASDGKEFVKNGFAVRRGPEEADKKGDLGQIEVHGRR